MDRILVLVAGILVSTAVHATPAACFAAASSEKIFTDDDYEKKMMLCQATGTAETVLCYQEALSLFRVVPERKAMWLCAGSPNTSPVTCYREAYDQVAERREKSRHALRLCTAKRG